MDDKELPEWYHMVRRVMLEFQAIDADAFVGCGGVAAYAQVRYAAERDVKLSGMVEQKYRDATKHCMEQTETGVPLPEELCADYVPPDVECGVCHAMNRAKNSNCWQCEAEL